MMRFFKAFGLAAVAVCSAGVASAATVDVFYKFRTGYSFNCNPVCSTTEGGVFEARLSYDNGSIEKVGEDGDTETFRVRYSGLTTAEFLTPIGQISFMANGSGSTLIDITDNQAATVFPGDSVQAVTDPTSNFFEIAGVVPFDDEFSLSLGDGGLFAFSIPTSEPSRDGNDSPTWFRFTNAEGETILGNEQQAIIDDLVISVSEEALPSPVPLPASAPLLLAGLGLLGWRARRRA